MIAFVPNGYFASGQIRAEQIAAKLGAYCGTDLRDCTKAVFVKCLPEEINLDRIELYLDLVDSDALLNYIVDKPQIKVIVVSKKAKEYVSCRVENKVFVIPEHHCNFNGEVRKWDKVTTAGYVGSKDCIDLDVIELRDKLRSVDIEFRWLFVDGLNVTREDVCEFYRGIDIQISYRKPRLIDNMPPELKNPLKLANAGSFKIPTVGYPELCWKEYGTGFLAAGNVKEIIYSCLALRATKKVYDNLAQEAYDKAQDYHIDKIATLYQEMLND